MKANPLLELKALGQSVWLDDLHRRMLRDGSLQRLIADDGLCGLTSNPAILAAAITGQSEYAEAAAAALEQAGGDVDLYETLMLDDVRAAADVFRPVYDRNDRCDGLVSVEVSPHLAEDASATIAEAHRLWARIDRPNVMIKVPGTRPGLVAITALIAAGINVNVTLLFSVARYRAVSEAWLAGLEQRAASHPIDSVASVASFFVSRIDTLVDRRLDELDRSGEAGSLRGRAAIACACGAYDHYVEMIRSQRWQALARRDARPQRLLWGSTSTKDRRYSDVKYVEELIASDTVTTLPPATLAAYRDHGEPSERFDAHRAGAPDVLERLERCGIDLDAIAEELEREGIRKFAEPFDATQRHLERLRRGETRTRA